MQSLPSPPYNTGIFYYLQIYDIEDSWLANKIKLYLQVQFVSKTEPIYSYAEAENLFRPCVLKNNRVNAWHLSMERWKPTTSSANSSHIPPQPSTEPEDIIRHHIPLLYYTRAEERATGIFVFCCYESVYPT